MNNTNDGLCSPPQCSSLKQLLFCSLSFSLVSFLLVVSLVFFTVIIHFWQMVLHLFILTFLELLLFHCHLCLHTVWSLCRRSGTKTMKTPKTLILTVQLPYRRTCCHFCVLSHLFTCIHLCSLLKTLNQTWAFYDPLIIPARPREVDRMLMSF